ncbi:protein kinase [Lentisphaera profundi]|uniref:Protein kinase n=1 Tax=Lentisphaera profundi TaxID=1658616 RepID=A0ABY7VTL9_9BACT|nr:protein kinase [Lentisphaera profundi]WDE97550.1 protein kinase [Lentisphaera profundi]
MSDTSTKEMKKSSDTIRIVEKDLSLNRMLTKADTIRIKKPDNIQISASSGGSLKIKIPALRKKEGGFAIRIICPSCSFKNCTNIQNLFDKVSCGSCDVRVRVPVETPKFIYENYIAETPCINIFQAYNKKYDFHGDVVTYEKLELGEHDPVKLEARLERLKNLKVDNYLNPQYFQHDETGYFITRANAPYRMNVYLQKRGVVKARKAAQILYQTTLIAADLAKEGVFGAFLPTDIMLDKKGDVKLCDYGVRDGIFEEMNEHHHIFIDSLAPETISHRIHDEHSAVYSLGILTVLFLTGKSPFQEFSPSKISKERENYLSHLEEYDLPVFLEYMLDMNVNSRPSLEECSVYFLQMIENLDTRDHF